MNISTKPPSGMRDFLPQEMSRRMFVVDVVRRVYSGYGFVPLETPSIENLSTLLGKYGEEGEHLLYRILHRRDALTRALGKDGVCEGDLADLGLRYDLTVPLARVVAGHELPRFFKRYQIQPVWRADRPGRGRFREFVQCDVDILGTTSLVAEAEVCAAVVEVLRELGFVDFRLKANHRGFLQALLGHVGIAPHLEESALVVLDKLDKLGEAGVRKEAEDRGIPSAAMDLLLGFLSEDLDALRARFRGLSALDELVRLQDMCRSDHFCFSPSLARGLSYYTGLIFEIDMPDFSGSLGGGGRYDGLIGKVGGKKMPAVGFSLGLERILVVMEERGMFPTDLGMGPEVLLCWLDVDLVEVLGVASRLRAQGLRVEVFPESAKLKRQLGYADRVGATFAGILGGHELSRGLLTLKRLQSGEQREIRIEEALSCVRHDLVDP